MPRAKNKQPKNGSTLDDKVKNGINKMSSTGKYILAAAIIVVALVVITFVSIHMAKVLSANKTAEFAIFNLIDQGFRLFP